MTISNRLSLQMLLLCCLTFFGTRVRAQQEAEIVSINAAGCLEYESDAIGNFIPDYSYAGYRNGEAPIPAVPTVQTIAPVSGDNTAHIQAAIDAVAALPMGADGIRGAVELAAGTYPVAGSLIINANGVVLRGVGQGDDPATSTIIVGEGNSPQARNLITVGGASFVSWNSAEAGTRSDIISPVVPAGARTIRVDNPGLYEVGDNVIITHPSTNEWLETINFGNTGSDAPWVAGQLDLIYNRYITAINSATGQITLDVPLYDRLDRSLSQAEVYVLNEPDIRRNSGVENLRIAVASSGALNEAHVRTAIFLEGVEDVWVRDVTALRFSYAAVNTEVATRVTVSGCSGLTPHSPITGGRRYNFAANFQSNNILFTDCTGSDGRHTFVCNAASTGSGIVFHNSTSSGDLSASEGHRRWSQALLFDNITFTDPSTFTLLGLYNRGNFGTGHGWSAVHSTAWGVSVPFSRFIVLQRPPGRQNYAVGCNALVTNEGPFVFPIGYSELTNETPAIASLYTTQLAKRLELGPLPDPPAGLSAFGYPDRTEINWQDVSAEETGYEVFISLDGGNTFNSLATVPADATTYDDVVRDNPENVRYRVVAQRNSCASPPSGHASVGPPPVDLSARFVTYFQQDTLPEINLSNSAGAVSTFTLDEACETLAISVTDPAVAPLGAFSPYVIRVRDDMGNDITDITERVNISMRVRTASPVTISTLFRSGGGGSDERSSLQSFAVPGDTTAWTTFTLSYGPDDLAGFNPADLRDCWFYLDRGTENFNGNEIFFDFIAIAGEADEDQFSPCSLDGEDAPLFAEYFTADTLTSVNVNSTAGLVSTFGLDTDCETLSLAVTDPANAPLPAFNAYQVRATDAAGDPIQDISENVSVDLRVRSAASVVLDFLFRSGAGTSTERSSRKAVTVPGDLENWYEFTLTWEAGELEGFDPTDLRDLWLYLDRGDENFNGNQIIFDHIVIGGEADELAFSPCSLDDTDPTAFFEYFQADNLESTSLNLNSSAGQVSTFNLNTECETLTVAVTDPVNAPLGGFDAFQFRATDTNGDPITDISTQVSVNFRARSAADVAVDFLFRSGGGTSGERSLRKSVTVPGDLDNWYDFTLTWEAGELEGFDPTDLRDLWMYLDRGDENFNGNEFILDHLVIGAAADESAFSPCSLGGGDPVTFFEYFNAPDLESTSLNLNSNAGQLATFDLDTECETLTIAVSDPTNAPLGGFDPFQFRATDANGDPITDISSQVSVNFRARSAAEVAVDFLFRSGGGTGDERSSRKSVTVPGDLENWYEFTLTWEAGDLEGFDPTDLRDLWVYLDRGDENFNGNEFILDHLVIGGVADEAFYSPCSLNEAEPTPFFEYFTADDLESTSVNLNSNGAVVTTFDLDTECETLTISVADPETAPLGAFSPYIIRASDDTGDPITNITGLVSVTVRVRSVAEVTLDFLFRSGAGGSDERSGRKSVTVPGDLESWSELTLTWEAGELEGFDPADLRDLWMYVDRGNDNFNGNELIFDHIVIGGTPDETLKSPCFLTNTNEAPELASVSVFPNPTQHTLSIRSDQPAALVGWELLDGQGRVLASGDNVRVPIQIGTFPQGMYVLRIAGQNGGFVHRRIIKL